MSIPFLATKFYRPLPCVDGVPRPRLDAALDRVIAQGHRFILLSASAGSGKTTLLAEWLAARTLAAAWLSLDEGDNDPVRFWSHVIGALQTVLPELGQNALEALRSPQPPPFAALMPVLLNELSARAEPVPLVLDDYHVIADRAVHAALAELLDHAPSSLMLALSTRADPPLPLARWRARDQMTEVRAADLRFTPEEARGFIMRRARLELQAEDIGLLIERTEGWAVGLQLAALALQGKADPHATLQSYSGTHHYVLDYLVSEVLDRQPERVQRLLLDTSILDRLCGPLCAAVTNEPDAGEMLADLDRANLFVIPLDDRNHWYRYHHLFADLLQARLKARGPAHTRELHARAAAWYDANGFPTDAVQHALASGDVERAGDIVEHNGHTRWAQSDRTFLQMIGTLPEELLRTRPTLGLYQAWMLFLYGKLDAARELLHAIEPHIADRAGTDAQAIRAFAMLLQAYISEMAEGDLSVPLPDPRALEFIPQERLAMRNSAQVVMASLLMLRGELEPAADLLLETAQQDEAAGGTTAIPIAISRLARIRIVQGKLQEAAALCREFDATVAARGRWRYYLGGLLRVTLASVLYRWNDLAGAERELAEGEAANAPWAIPWAMAQAALLRARLSLARGDTEQAVEHLSGLRQRIGASLLSPDVAVEWNELQVRLWLAQGHFVGANAWAASVAPLAPSAGPRELDRLTYARVRLAAGEAAEAQRIAADIARRGGQQGRSELSSSARLLEAQALENLGFKSRAMEALQEPLALAERSENLRLFLDLDDAGRTLVIEALEATSDRSAFTRELAALLAREHPSAPPRVQDSQSERLTPREREVLACLARGDTNQAIADALVITLSAVKKHTGNIYGKLGVSNRTQAVARARQLGLLSD